MDRKVVMPAGAYYIGDPCYYVPDHMWDEVTRKAGCFEEHSTVEINGERLLAFFTKYGDGVYTGSDGRQYDVDSGTIGLTPASIVKKKDKIKKYLISFSKDIVCTCEDGLITIGNIKIETGDSYVK